MNDQHMQLAAAAEDYIPHVFPAATMTRSLQMSDSQNSNVNDQTGGLMATPQEVWKPEELEGRPMLREVRLRGSQYSLSRSPLGPRSDCRINKTQRRLSPTSFTISQTPSEDEEYLHGSPGEVALRLRFLARYKKIDAQSLFKNKMVLLQKGMSS